MDGVKALVLANGHAPCAGAKFIRRRARELVPVANQPILFYALEAIRDAEIRDVALVVHPQTGEEIREAVGDGSYWQLAVSYVAHPELGLIRAIEASSRILGDAPFVVYPSSGILVGALQPLLRRFRRNRLAALVPLGASDGGAAQLPAQRQGHVPAPRVDPERHQGVYVFAPSVHVAARATNPSWRGQLELEDVLQTLAKSNQRVERAPMEMWWSNGGRARELLEGNRLVLDQLVDDRGQAYLEDSVIEGRVALAASASIESSTVRGPAIIGSGARLADAYVGPYTSVGPGAVIRGTELENSIIMRGAALKELERRVAGSVVGEYAVVNRDFVLPRVFELAVAHGSRARLG